MPMKKIRITYKRFVTGSLERHLNRLTGTKSNDIISTSELTRPARISMTNSHNKVLNTITPTELSGFQFLFKKDEFDRLWKRNFSPFEDSLSPYYMNRPILFQILLLLIRIITFLFHTTFAMFILVHSIFWFNSLEYFPL